MGYLINKATPGKFFKKRHYFSPHFFDIGVVI